MNQRLHMEAIMDFAKEKGISIEQACALYDTATKKEFSEMLYDRINNAGIAVELYTKNDHPIGISLDDIVTTQMTNAVEISGSVTTN